MTTFTNEYGYWPDWRPDGTVQGGTSGTMPNASKIYSGQVVLDMYDTQPNTWYGAVWSARRWIRTAKPEEQAEEHCEGRRETDGEVPAAQEVSDGPSRRGVACSAPLSGFIERISGSGLCGAERPFRGTCVSEIGVGLQEQLHISSTFTHLMWSRSRVDRRSDSVSRHTPQLWNTALYGRERSVHHPEDPLAHSALTTKRYTHVAAALTGAASARLVHLSGRPRMTLTVILTVRRGRR